MRFVGNWSDGQAATAWCFCRLPRGREPRRRIGRAKSRTSIRLASDLGAAVTAARQLLPPDYVPQIVLLTDGNETQGDLRAAAARVGVPVSVVPLDSLASPEVYVA